MTGPWRELTLRMRESYFIMDSLVSFGLTKMGDPCLGKPSKKKEKTFFTFKGGSRSVFVTLFKNMFKVKCFFSAITLRLKIGGKFRPDRLYRTSYYNHCNLNTWWLLLFTGVDWEIWECYWGHYWGSGCLPGNHDTWLLTASVSVWQSDTLRIVTMAPAFLPGCCNSTSTSIKYRYPEGFFKISSIFP